MKRLPRPVESVVLSEGVMEDLISDAKTFLGRRDWYIERGTPYGRGYLLNGSAGTGKTSAVVAIASALGMNIAMLSLGDSNMEDSGISELFSSIPVNRIVLS